MMNAARAMVLGLVACAPGPMPAHAEDPLHRTADLDIDGDGAMDHASVTTTPDGDANLVITFGGRRPPVLKTRLTTERILGVAAGGKGALIIRYGCGGCSNDVETTLTIVDRGTILVARFASTWDTRTAMGRCDIDLLAGRGVVARGLNGRPVKVTVAPARITLAQWSEDRRPAACGR